ncbi:unnamed protein product [Mycetohabitans rhizoxinica HKI 454]|uniref:Uncharacterized protein n=1 Tax=Mycetohabitans rhizoxinica (strain DSM 19002 / CIP 109453 / HKI 454) TaxID=882378 RepID=E5ARU6_MYCRK|nr:unnamed protein product [Mycetohabitans rhizoxinica HKI 454]
MHGLFLTLVNSIACLGIEGRVGIEIDPGNRFLDTCFPAFFVDSDGRRCTDGFTF